MAGNDFEFAFSIAGNLAGSFTSAFRRAGDEMQMSQERAEELRGQLRRLESSFEAGGMSAHEFEQRNQQLTQAMEQEGRQFNELKGKLQESGANIQVLRQKLQVLGTAYRTGGMSAGEFERQQREVSQAIRQEIQQQTGLRRQLQDSRQRTQQLRQETRQLTTEYRQGQAAVQRYENQHRELTESLEAETSRQEALRGQIQASNRTFGALGAMATPYLGWGALAVAAGAGVMSLASSMDNLQMALSSVEQGTGATEAEMAQFRDTMLDIYSEGIGNDFADIGAAMKTAKQITGQAGEELKNVSKNALMIRDAFDIDVNESMRAADSLMKKFGISADQAYTLIAQGAQNGANRNGDLADTLNEYAVQFAQLGFTADDFTDVLVAGAQDGAFSIDKVGDAVKEFNIRVKDGSKSTGEGFAAIGLDAEEMAQAFTAGGESAQDAMYKTMEALMGLEDPVARNQAGVNLFGTMWEDLGEEGVRALMKVSGKVDMTADTLQKLEVSRISSFGQAFDLMGRQIESAVLGPLSAAAMPLIKEFAGFLIENADSIKTYAVPAIAGLAVAVGGLALAFAGPAIAAVGTFIASVGWIPLAVGGVVAAGVALVQNWQSVAPFFSDLWGKVKTSFETVCNAIQPVITQLQGTFQGAFNQISTAFGGFIDTIGPFAEAVMPILEPIAMFVGGAFVGAFIVAFDVICGVINTFVNVAASYITMAIEVFTGINTFITGVFSGEWSKAWEGIVQIFTSIFGGIKKIAGNILDGVKGTINSITSGIKAVTGSGEGGKGADISQNASGGIYRQGAFLTTFAEESPEAAIPLDGSPRAISLWQQAGQMLGMFPAGGYLEGRGNADTATGSDFSQAVQVLSPQTQGPSIFERAAAHFSGGGAGGGNGAGIEFNLTVAPQITVTAAGAGGQDIGKNAAEQIMEIIRREVPGILKDIAHENVRMGFS